MSGDQWVILGPVLAALVGLVAVGLQNWGERKRRERARLYEDRRKIYMQVIEPFVLAFTPGQEKKVLKLMQSAEYGLAAREFSLIGTDDSVRALNGLMQYFYHREIGDSDSQEVLNLLGGFFLGMRREWVGRKTELDVKDMFRGQITDIDSFMD